MKKIKPIKTGVLGIGRAGYEMHIPELKRYGKYFEVTGCCDVDADRRKLARQATGCTVYDQYEDMLKNPDIELIAIVSRSPDHLKHARQALKAGKIVFLEKPVAMNYGEAKKLKVLHDRYPGKLFLRHNRRLEPTFQHVREIMASGLLGKIHLVKLHRHFFQRRKDWQTILDCGGGLLNNWGPHLVDHAIRMVDAPIREIWSDLQLISSLGDAEDHIKLLLKGGNGRVVDLELSYGSAIPMPEYVIYGDRGALTADAREIRLKYVEPGYKFKVGKAERGTPPFGAVSYNPEPIPWVEKTIPVNPSSGLAMNDIYKCVYQAVRENVPFPITIEEGMEIVRVSEHIRKKTPFKYPSPDKIYKFPPAKKSAKK